MDVLKIPFVSKLGITRAPEGAHHLPFDESVQHHLQTVYAGIQFALAETATGYHQSCSLSITYGPVISSDLHFCQIFPTYNKAGDWYIFNAPEPTWICQAFEGSQAPLKSGAFFLAWL
jgi:hypothetical protein